MKFPFTIKPTHWWDNFNPLWWLRKRKIEKVLAYAWETQNLELRFSDAIHDAYVLGEGGILIDWEGK